jgi:hypothetical protein
MKMEDGGVDCKIYNGCCRKQQVKISKVTWMSPILRKMSTCWISFNKTSLMKDDVKGLSLVICSYNLTKDEAIFMVTMSVVIIRLTCLGLDLDTKP